MCVCSGGFCVRVVEGGGGWVYKSDRGVCGLGVSGSTPYSNRASGHTGGVDRLASACLSVCVRAVVVACCAGRPHRSEYEADREYELAVDEMKGLLGAGRCVCVCLCWGGRGGAGGRGGEMDCLGQASECAVHGAVLWRGGVRETHFWRQHTYTCCRSGGGVAAWVRKTPHAAEMPGILPCRLRRQKHMRWFGIAADLTRPRLTC